MYLIKYSHRQTHKIIGYMVMKQKKKDVLYISFCQSMCLQALPYSVHVYEQVSTGVEREGIVSRLSSLQCTNVGRPSMLKVGITFSVLWDKLKVGPTPTMLSASFRIAPSALARHQQEYADAIEEPNKNYLAHNF